jgi:ubiquinone/menaquinone biosynthesis C-methylase UbiE
VLLVSAKCNIPTILSSSNKDSAAEDAWSVWGAAWAARFLGENPSIQGAKSITSLANTAVPFSTATRILDFGCGTGDLVATIVSSHSPSAQIIASDLSPGMLSQTAARGEDWKGVEYKILDATKMTELKDASFSHVLSNFTLYFLPVEALNESYRILQKGGVLVSSYMTKAPWMDLLAPVSAVRPDKIIPSGYEVFGKPGVAKGSVEAAGFKDYEEVEIPVFCRFEDPREIVNFVSGNMPFLPAMTGDFTELERAKWKELMVEFVEREYPDKVLRGKALVVLGRK